MTAALAARIRGALDVALEVDCPECEALAGEVCTAHEAPLLWPHISRHAAGRDEDTRMEWSA